jgi:hypothetical protein
MLLTLIAVAMLSPVQVTKEGTSAAHAAAQAAADAAQEAATAADDAAAAAGAVHYDHSGGAVYDPARDADADVATAAENARANGRMLMIVLGGNWCHDSRGLASYFAEDDFRSMLRRRYEIVYVDVGMRDRNLQIPARYGITSLTGTPTVLIISPEGQLLNRGTASSWRNAASRRRATVYSAFANFRQPGARP